MKGTIILFVDDIKGFNDEDMSKNISAVAERFRLLLRCLETLIGFRVDIQSEGMLHSELEGHTRTCPHWKR